MVAEEGYVGIDVHRAARIGSVGHGGQVLLSETTTSEIRNLLPKDTHLRDLGEYMLKDIREPEQISQLVINRMASDFPPLKTLSAWPNNLPNQPTPFIGRKKELADLDELLDNADVRLVTIVGAGGMGKTRLALESGEQQLFKWTSSNGKETLRFPNGVYFVPLASLDSTVGLLTAIAQAVNFQFYQGGEPKKQLLDYFREKQILLIMDNFEHMLDGTKLLAEIIQEATGVKALVTSRQMLNLRSENVYTLGGMTIPKENRSRELDQSSAVDLFVGTAQRMNPDVELTTENMRHVTHICSLVEGLPLGLELAASWVKVLSVEEIAREIQNSLDFLESEMHDVPKRHQSIRAVFDYSWKMLDRSERQIFKKLSVFRGGFDHEALRSITGATLKQLLGLVSKSLIRKSQTGRYEIHELLRQYAAGKLNEIPQEEEKVRVLHCEYFANFMAHQEATITGGVTRKALTEIDNIRTGWQLATKREMVPEIRKQMLSLYWLYEIQGWYQEAEATFKQAADFLRMEEPVGDKGIAFGYLLALLAVFISRVSSYEKGLQSLRASWTLLRQLDAQQEIAHANMLAVHLGLTTDYEEQKKILNESFETYEGLGIRWGMVNALMYLGMTASANSEYERAEKYFQEVLKISKETHNRRGVSWSLLGLGQLSHVQDDYAQAEGYFADALDISKEIGYQLSVFVNLHDLGHNALLLGDYKMAHECFEEAFVLAENSGNQIWKGSAYIDFGNLALALENTQEARDKYHSALEIGLNAQDEALCLDSLAGLAALLNTTGDNEQAVELAVLAVNHPNIDMITREKTKKLLEELDTSLSQKVFAVAQERGKALELMPTVEHWLAELGS